MASSNQAGTVTLLSAAEILDSRGYPTIEVMIGAGRETDHASVPSGKSTGRFEALELRARLEQRPLFASLGGDSATLLPVPCFNVINGGAHADNRLDFQEFMLVPAGRPTYAEALHALEWARVVHGRGVEELGRERARLEALLAEVHRVLEPLRDRAA